MTPHQELSDAPAGPVGELRPSRRPDVILGPAFLRGPRTVHIVKDGRAHRYYELGEREYFVLSRLDGQRSLADIDAAYAGRFQRRLGPRNWTELLGMFWSRGLLAEAEGATPAPAPSSAPAVEAPTSRWRGSGWLDRRLVLSEPAGLLRRVDRGLGWIFSPAGLWPLLALCAALLVIIGVNRSELIGGAPALFREPSLGALVALALWGSAALHELAHGLACVHFGGSVSEIGLRIRIPMLYPYCRVEDVRLFRSVGHRAATMLAGVYVNLVLLLPFVPLWMFLPADDDTRQAIGALLVVGAAMALVNLLPLPPLDGHKLLTHLLGVSDLSREAGAYLLQVVRAAFGRPNSVALYPRWAALAYPGYAVAFVLVVAAEFVATLWFGARYLPAGYAIGLAIVLTVVYLGRFVAVAVMRNRAARIDKAKGAT